MSEGNNRWQSLCWRLERNGRAVPWQGLWMHRFVLRFASSRDCEGKDVPFEAADASRALFIAHSEARSRSAELWRDGERLCRIEPADRSTRDFWIIS